MVSAIGPRSTYPEQRLVAQRITAGPTLEAKLHNMRKAIVLLDHLDIPPGGILSFWHLVGEPGKKQGFLPGRNIVNGQLIVDYGGGLCQLSAAMYELALQTDLEILERHAHSTNVYTPETTYTPLGLDATLAYGYKDLRLRNQYPFPVHFSFELSDQKLRVRLCSLETLPAFSLRVDHESSDHGLTAKVFKGDGVSERLISNDFYRAWAP
jgi:vancomycin resistance protein VanW